ncbi:oligosaccharide flippase family protein [Vibrio cyclitrophicus]|nr:polysaccharide biosynthesis C-terminal domain-containing protein [Vibrio cyclitrophicus]UPR52359.1 oligosaccharide flippase family protein [Vibrio cyclitrophicus]
MIKTELIKVVSTVFYKFGITIFNAATLALISWFYGSEGVAFFALVRTVPLIFTILTDLGLSHSYSYMINSRKCNVSTVISSQVVLFLMLSLLQITLWYLMTLGMFDMISVPIDIYNSPHLMLLPPLMVASFHFVNISRAMGELKQANNSLILIELLIFSTVGFLVFFDKDIKLLNECVTLSYICTISYYTIKNFSRFKGVIKFKISKPEIKEIISFGVKSQLGNGCQILNYRFDQIIVNHFLGSELLGVYVIAVKFAEIFRVINTSIIFVFEPFLSKIDKKDSHQIIIKNSLIVFIANFLIIFLSSLVVPYIIPVVFDDWALSALPSFYIIVLGLVVSGGNALTIAYFLGNGHPQYVTSSIGGGFLCNIILNLILTPYYGLIGASISSASSYLISTIVLWTLFIYKGKSNG